ncbi:aspartate racemase [Candidatus Peregrinibacteria bacterium CG11_big_fil_rev_8_21_14_0_20_41_10]|nr:MAG: aspartate racemase [Candidatus Peregrinibacteria bacterium CG11_big_fil_rev_8_21_14_0_20_41_10]PJC38207.1 MAG: aspartate racemase [Candidatus Peregrinibacteria bacterium CG_4_9_14_0_2_um_filter_41_14]
MSEPKVCGILGGLGPTATADLYKAIITSTPAEKDQDHLHIIINANPRIPDRTADIINGTTFSLPGLIKSAQTLEQAGANFIVMPCNTVHHFLDVIQAEINIPILDMIKLTAQALHKLNYKKVGMLSTSATIKSQLYQKALKEFNIEIVGLTLSAITNSMEIIYGPKGIKAGVQYEFSDHNRDLALAVIAEQNRHGAEAIILGCTEIPLAIKPSQSPLPLINATQVLAEAIVAECWA